MKTRALLCLAILAALLQPSSAEAAAASGPRFDPDLTKLLDTDAGKIGVIIQYRSAPTGADGEALLDAGFAPGLIRFSVVPAVSAVGPAAAIKGLADNPRIAYVEDDEQIPYTLDRATVAGRAQQIWDATYKLSGEVHDTGITGRGIGVAIVDSGIDATHPDLIWEPLASAKGVEPKTTANLKIVGRDSPGFYSEDPVAGPFFEANQLTVDVPHSDNTGGHGTHVAGIAGGNGASSEGKFKGAAPGANLIGYGAGETLVVTMGLAAFDHIHLHHRELGIRVVNNSWGGAGEWDPESSITKAAQRLVNEDRLAVVFAAGNSGGDGTSLQSSVWGNIPEMIQVANYYDRTGWLDGSSSRGRRDREDTWPDLAAPGTQIISTAATAGPVTYVGTAQDAVIDDFLQGSEEPTVVSVQTPTNVVENDELIVGNYASFTGTSMAAPFVSGVIALMLEANPALTPEQVKEILRETANMPDGKTYDKDGFGIGKGVVDAAEAVAVSLRTREGASVEEALSTAHVDSSATPYKLNMSALRSFEITSPTAGEEVHTTLDVSGNLFRGSQTDNSIPLAPSATTAPTITGDAHVYQASALDPFVAGTTTVLPGEPVGLGVRAISSRDGNVVVAVGQSARHVVSKDGTVVAELPTTAAADGEAVRTDTEWTVPADAAGRHVFDGYLTVGGTEYHVASLPFDVGVPSDVSLPVSTGGTAAQTTLLAEGFEGAADGWTTEQNAEPGPGLLTEWRATTADAPSFYGPASGSGWYQATIGPPPAEAYSDQADVALVSPLIDLNDLQSASATFWRAGASEGGADFLEAYVDPEGDAPPVLLERLSQTFAVEGFGLWTESPSFDLSSYIGQQVRLRFRFVSDELSLFPNAPGWNIDDVEVSGVSGAPAAALSVTPASGPAPLETVFDFGFSGEPSSFELDFGDGTSHTTTEAGRIAHTYAAGAYTAVLTVKDAAGAVLGTARTDIDALPRDGVQLRIVHAQGETPWVTTPVAESGAFAHTFDISALPLGSAIVQARYIGIEGRTLRRSVAVDIISANIAPGANDDTATVRSGATVVIPVLANDSDPDGDPLTLTRVDATGTSGGAITNLGDGTVRYTPPPNFVGRDTFTYTVSDAGGATDSATVTVDVLCSKTTKKRPGVKRCR